MTYYEELGVVPNASVEEIRRAYKSLVRLLHPDRFPDESLKQLAELQMRRLHQMLALLSDPAERLRYDIRLRVSSEAPNPQTMETLLRPATKSFWSRSWATGLCAWLPPVVGFGLFVGVMIYYGGGGREFIPNSVAASTEDRVIAPSSPPPVTTVSKPRAASEGVNPESLRTQLREAQQELVALHAERQKLLEQLGRAARPPQSEESFPELPPGPKPVTLDNRGVTTLVHLEPAIIEAPRAAPPRLTGHWYYVPDPHQVTAAGVYTPEYVELQLTEDGQAIRGRYHARYRITDQVISPEVVFQFEGPSDAPIVRLPWTGAGDSKGAVTLRLVSADQLFVSWTTTRLSADLNLASGMAQLTRQKESR